MIFATLMKSTEKTGVRMNLKIRIFLVNDDEPNKPVYTEVSLRKAQRLMKEEKYFQDEPVVIGDISCWSNNEVTHIYLEKVRDDEE